MGADRNHCGTLLRGRRPLGRRRAAERVDLLVDLGVMDCDHKIMWWWPARPDVRNPA